MKDLKLLIKDVERDLVINLILGVRHGRIGKREAIFVSRSFMASFPFQNYEALFRVLNVLSDKYKEVRKVYIKYFPEYQSEKREKTLERMREFMRNNDIENAIKAAKEVNNYGR